MIMGLIAFSSKFKMMVTVAKPIENDDVHYHFVQLGISSRFAAKLCDLVLSLMNRLLQVRMTMY
jgi:hypothetical protein